MTLPVVSVIIPTFNRGDLLLETVSSCHDQGDVLVDIIVVDDSSSDGSIGRLKKEFPEIRVYSQSHRGASAARNLGVKKAAGEYIKFIDSDDKLSKGVLQRQVDALKASSADLVYGDFELYGNAKDATVVDQHLHITGPVDDLLEALLSDWWCALFCYLYRSSAIFDLTWNEELECLQDFDFNLKAARSGVRFHYDKGIVGHYRMHAGEQITDSSKTTYARSRCKVMDSMKEFLIDNGKWKGTLKDSVLNNYWIASRACFKKEPQNFKKIQRFIKQESPFFCPKFGASPVLKIFVAGFGITLAEYVVSCIKFLLRKQ